MTTRVFQNKKLCGGPAVVLCWVTVWVKQTTFQKSYLKKKSFRNAREWKLRIWDPKQKTNFAREAATSPPSLSPPRARFDWGPRAYERCWKARGCTHTPHKSFAGTQSGKIRAFYIVSLSPFIFFVAKKEKPQGKLGERKEKLLYLVSKKRIFFSFPLHFLARAFARICARI